MVSNSTMILLLFVCVFLYVDSSTGHELKVGGRDGWVVHPSEDYSHCSRRLRFVINDTLYFGYKKGEDSVLQVAEGDYYKCNTSNPIWKAEDGASVFKLTRSGPFYFISGVNCEKGQRLFVQVLGLHHHIHHSISPSPSPSYAHPPAKSPSHSPAVSPAPSSASPSPSPASPSPRISPAPASPSPRISPAPAAHSPRISPAPAAHSPSVSPAPAAHSPSVSPAPATQSPSVSPAPASPSPEELSPSPIAFPPAADEGTSPAPAPSKSSAAKILMGLPVTVALMACTIVLI